MPEAVLLREIFSNQNPLAFRPEKVQELKSKHGLRPAWVNERWHGEMAGWEGFRPIKFGDPKAADVLACCKVDILGDDKAPEERIKHGDLVLCVIPDALYEREVAKQHYRTNRSLDDLEIQNTELRAELNKLGVQTDGGTSDFRSGKGDLREVEAKRRPGITTKSLGQGSGGKG